MLGGLRVRAAHGAGANPYRGCLASDGNGAMCVLCPRVARENLRDGALVSRLC